MHPDRVGAGDVPGLPSFLRAVVVDYDGTLAEHDRPDAEALRVLAEVRGSGRRVVLATGRILEELLEVFPDVADHVDAVVAENGGVLSRDGSVRLLARPVDAALDGAMIDSGFSFRRGHVLLATRAEHNRELATLTERLGLECQLVHNRAELMVLPSGVSKATGVVAGLAEFGLSAHNAVAFGDAENDHSLLDVCAVGVAVANAVPSLRRRADIVATEAAGRGVAEVLAGSLLAEHGHRPPERWSMSIGRTPDGSAVRIPSARVNVLVAGPTVSGKSYVAGLLAEQAVGLGYSVVVIDPEGDHEPLGWLPEAICLGGDFGLPSPGEVRSLLDRHIMSIVFDLSGQIDEVQDRFVRELLPLIEASEEASGRPHWVIVDEAHRHTRWLPEADALGSGDHTGYCLVTYRHELVSPGALAGLDLLLLAPGTGPLDTVLDAGGWPDGVVEALEALSPGQVLLVRRDRLDDGEPRLQVVHPGQRRIRHVRHLRKYVRRRLPPAQRFYFRRDDDHLTGAVAANLVELRDELIACDDETIRHHARGGDFSRWLRAVFKDRHLAERLERLEADLTGGHPTTEGRELMLQAIDERCSSEG